MKTILLFVLSVLAFTHCAGTGLADGEAVTVTVKPDTVYIERSETGQYLNFDFLLENRTDRELLLTGIELSAFDDHGRLTRRIRQPLQPREPRTDPAPRLAAEAGRPHL